jgi:hypothetical protein
MAKARQLTVWVDSVPGQLGRIAEALGEASINISGFVSATLPGQSPVRLLTSSPVKTRKVLEGLGLRITEEEVLRVSVGSKPGVLGEIGQRLGRANINVEYAYASVAKGSRKADVILGVSDMTGAAKALRGI